MGWGRGWAGGKGWGVMAQACRIVLIAIGGGSRGGGAKAGQDGAPWERGVQPNASPGVQITTLEICLPKP